ncbi:hypothetical protein DM860_003774 [Cuscuta australis]|uniref:Uncharacterized protein n=1 Tax=Cuscuta australis TaxID=267555 RepID=A0A328DGS3_9ASTE|nr:hypothetical protein DM860_003774 [Cuscuta australis]
MEDYRIEETAPSPNKASPQLNCKILYVSGFRGTSFHAFNNDAAAPASDETHVRTLNTPRTYVASGESLGGNDNTPPNVASAGGINNATKNEDDIRSNRTLYDDAVQGDLEVTERLVKEDNKVCI